MLKVIIVDDEALSVKRLQRLLSKNGWIEICQTFQHPREAYEYAKANPIDVAFLDISMPHINGMKLSALLAELDNDLNFSKPFAPLPSVANNSRFVSTSTNRVIY